MIKLIIFDWDDVFTLGSKEGYFKCYDQALQSVGVHMSKTNQKKMIIPNWGKSHHEILDVLLSRNEKLVEEAEKMYMHCLFGDLFVDCLEVVKGSDELLIRLSAQYKLALASGIHPELLKNKVMPRLRLPNVFSNIITAYDLRHTGNTKPHPHTVNTIMQKEKVHPHETIVVGDAKNDVLMAQNAGVTPVAVLTGHLSRREAEDIGVNYIIDDVTNIDYVLDQINARQVAPQAS